MIKNYFSKVETEFNVEDFQYSGVIEKRIFPQGCGFYEERCTCHPERAPKICLVEESSTEKNFYNFSVQK